MVELKTKPTDQNVKAFLEGIPDQQKREDCQVLMALMGEATGAKAEMWGDSIVGFDRYRYQYASGHKGEYFLAGFSPRKQNLTLYIMSGFDQYESLMARLGKHSTGKSCLYIKRLADVDVDVLKELVRLSTEHMRRTNAPGADRG